MSTHHLHLWVSGLASSVLDNQNKLHSCVCSIAIPVCAPAEDMARTRSPRREQGRLAKPLTLCTARRGTGDRGNAHVGRGQAWGHSALKLQVQREPYTIAARLYVLTFLFDYVNGSVDEVLELKVRLALWISSA